MRTVKDAVDIHNFYTGKTIEFDMGEERQPTVNFLASVVACALIVTGPLHGDLVQTLTAPWPVDRLIFRKNTSQISVARWAQDLLLVLPLQLAWALRCFFLPACAAMGTAFALAGADSAVDIVLKCVMAGRTRQEGDQS